MPLAACVLAVLVGARSQAIAGSQLAAGQRPPVDVNSASVETLQAALSVSSDEARQIAAHRPYQSIEEFKTKSGLTANEADRLALLVSVTHAGQPPVPAGAVPISPDVFRKGVAGAPPSNGSPDVPPGTVTPVPVPNGTIQRVPVPPGTVRRNIPVPAPQPLNGVQPAHVRDLRAAFMYGLIAAVVAVAAVVYLWRTSPKRRAGKS